MKLTVTVMSAFHTFLSSKFNMIASRYKVCISFNIMSNKYLPGKQASWKVRIGFGQFVPKTVIILPS